MICKRCGRYVDENAEYCMNCGERVNNNEPRYFKSYSANSNANGGVGETTVLNGKNPYGNNNRQDNNNAGTFSMPKQNGFDNAKNTNFATNQYNFMNSNENFSMQESLNPPLQTSSYIRRVGIPYKLKTNYGLLKMLFLSIITFGIYGVCTMSNISMDINMVASSHDGKRTMNYCLVVFVFSALTLGIVPFVWYHRLSKRIGNELKRRGIQYNFDASSFWLWSILGSLIFVGPFIYTHKLLKAINLLNDDFNKKNY